MNSVLGDYTLERLKTSQEKVKELEEKETALNKELMEIRKSLFSAEITVAVWENLYKIYEGK